MDANSSTIIVRNFTSSRRPLRPRLMMPRPVDEWDEVVTDEWTKFTALHHRCISISDKIETSLLIVGLLGNLLALATLLRARQMRTPSFVYHKALVSAYLIYCANFLIVKYVNYSLTIPSVRQQLSYYNPLAAYYAGILNRVITSVCGYLTLYTSLAISVDRFLALVMFKSYAKFNRHMVAYMWVASSLFMSVCVHSWAPWLENDVQAERVALDPSNRNHTTMTYRHQESVGREQLKPYLMAKDWYNLVIRFAYAILLTVLTCTVIYMFSQQQKRRSTLCNVSKRQIRRERSLFYLMIAVVIMAYIQVIPRESKRVLELIYPPEYVAGKIDDPALSVKDRRWYLLFGLYAFTFTTPILNLCTTIERSLLFYLYFSLNHTFRKEVLTLLRIENCWQAVLVKFSSHSPEEIRRRRRTQSDDRSRTSGQGRELITGGFDGDASSISNFDAATACSRNARRQGSETSCASEYRRFLSPVSRTRKSSSRSAGSTKTMCSEYSSVV